MEENKSNSTETLSIFSHYHQLTDRITLNEVFKAVFPLKKINISEKSLQQSYFLKTLKENEIIQKMNVHLFDVHFYKRTKIFKQISKNEIQHHFLDGNNRGLFLSNPESRGETFPFFISNHVSDKTVFSNAIKSVVIPVYLYPENTVQQNMGLVNNRIPNFSKIALTEIEKRIGIPFRNEYPSNFKAKNNSELKFFTPNELLEYIIGVFYLNFKHKSDSTILELLKFSINLPDTHSFFNQIRKIGRNLMGLFLLDSSMVSSYVTQFPEDGDNFVSEIRIENYQEEDFEAYIKVYINETQYFSHVSKAIWDFQFSNYKPIQVWLQTRISKTLSFDEIMCFHKIVKAVSELGSV